MIGAGTISSCRQPMPVGRRVWLTLKRSPIRRRGCRLMAVSVARERETIPADAGKYTVHLPAIFCRSSRQQLLCYIPKSSLAPEVRHHFFSGGIWKIEGYFQFPEELCRLMQMSPGAVLYGQPYTPVEVSSHLVFCLRYQE